SVRRVSFARDPGGAGGDRRGAGISRPEAGPPHARRVALRPLRAPLSIAGACLRPEPVRAGLLPAARGSSARSRRAPPTLYRQEFERRLRSRKIRRRTAGPAAFRLQGAFHRASQRRRGALLLSRGLLRLGAD